VIVHGASRRRIASSVTAHPQQIRNLMQLSGFSPVFLFLLVA
jgi:hypothetical protein